MKVTSKKVTKLKVTSKRVTKLKIKIELNQKEAETLMAIMACVAGCEKNSPRKHATELFDALKKETGLDYQQTEAYQLLGERSNIHFNDYPK